MTTRQDSITEILLKLISVRPFFPLANRFESSYSTSIEGNNAAKGKHNGHRIGSTERHERSWKSIPPEKPENESGRNGPDRGRQ